eukprot:gene6823-4903_t
MRHMTTIGETTKSKTNKQQNQQQQKKLASHALYMGRDSCGEAWAYAQPCIERGAVETMGKLGEPQFHIYIYIYIYIFIYIHIFYNFLLGCDGLRMCDELMYQAAEMFFLMSVYFQLKKKES